MSASVGAPQLANMLGEWAGDAALPEALSEAVTELIDAGLIAAGSVLPPQRQLATALGVSRGTVAAAYGRLEGEGYVLARQGSGYRVRSTRGRTQLAADGRMFSFTQSDASMLDLSSGALPASEVARVLLRQTRGDVLTPYLDTDGYFPEGLPILRSAIAERLTLDGITTSPQEVLITNGAQQGTWLSFLSTLTPGDLALVEEPTYRGALSALSTVGARVEGIPFGGQGCDPALVARAVRRGAVMLYCQTSIHNPTGQSMTAASRSELAATLVDSGLVTIEDCCGYDLTLKQSPTAPTLARHLPTSQLIMVGTLSKVFWGGLRVGWIRADKDRIRGLVSLRKATDLAVGVLSQLQAVALLSSADEARQERRQYLSQAFAVTEELVGQYFPDWTWAPVAGGPGLWIDIGQDAVTLAEVAKRSGIKLAAGPSFSVYQGFRSYVRLPVWHERDSLHHALSTLVKLVHP